MLLCMVLKKTIKLCVYQEMEYDNNKRNQANQVTAYDISCI